ncbi:MAG: ferredoxin reductase [Solirubrobacteraceae bacterium]
MTRRILRSPLVDLLVGPHGIDRYLELIRPDLTVRDARAQVVSVRRRSARSVTLGLRANDAWRGFRAGQFVRVGVEIDGVRRTRTYSPASSEHGARDSLELTVTTHPEGLVSRHMREQLSLGSIVHLGPAQGDFVLPEPRPERLVLISGGSGATPVMAMLRTLCEEGHGGEVVFVHYARTAADWLYETEVRALAARHAGVTVSYRATRERDGHVSAESLRELAGDLRDTHAAVCGPPALIDAVRDIWASAGVADRVLAETFTPPRLALDGAAARGTIRFLNSRRSAPVAGGSLLEQAEAAGLSPDFGCRMGICHTCTCRKSAGAVRNVLTGEVSAEEDEDIQLCVSVPAGDVALEL